MKNTAFDEQLNEKTSIFCLLQMNSPSCETTDIILRNISTFLSKTCKVSTTGLSLKHIMHKIENSKQGKHEDWPNLGKYMNDALKFATEIELLKLYARHFSPI